MRENTYPKINYHYFATEMSYCHFDAASFNLKVIYNRLNNCAWAIGIPVENNSITEFYRNPVIKSFF